MTTNPLFVFEEAQRIACKASIQIEGLSGRGKSGLALLLGYYLSGEDWTKVFAIDTENKSLKLFRDLVSSAEVPYGAFQIGELTADIGYKPSNYIAFREVAKEKGAKAVIEDSISHAWQYKGGVLDMVNDAKRSSVRYQKDSYAAWSDEKVMEEKLKLMELLRDDGVHVITTTRVKEKMEYGQDSTGKNTLISLGEQQIQQSELKYEPDLVLHMLKAGGNTSKGVQHPVAKVIKSRYAIFQLDEEYEFTPNLMRQLKSYLEEGIDPAEIAAQQQEEYVAAVKDYLDSHPNAKAIWKVMKKDAGFDDNKLEELPLDGLKKLYIKLIS